ERAWAPSGPAPPAGARGPTPRRGYPDLRRGPGGPSGRPSSKPSRRRSRSTSPGPLRTGPKTPSPGSRRPPEVSRDEHQAVVRAAVVASHDGGRDHVRIPVVALDRIHEAVADAVGGQDQEIARADGP